MIIVDGKMEILSHIDIIECIYSIHIRETSRIRNLNSIKQIYAPIRIIITSAVN